MIPAELTLIDVALACGIALVLPATLGGHWRWWALAGGGALGACLADPGAVGVALTLPWGVALAATGLRVLRSVGPRHGWGIAELLQLLTVGFVGVAWVGLVASCAGAQPFGIADPFNELAAVHFTYVGGGALPLAAAAWASASGPCSEALAVVAIALTAGAPPVIALGFVIGNTVLLVAGAVLLTMGVWCTGAVELRRALRGRGPVAVRVLFGLSGLAVVVPMVLAVAWSAGQRWDIPILSIQDMARTHGMGNAIGFIGAGLLALRLDRTVREEVPAWS
jgi:hypothetical protein